MGARKGRLSAPWPRSHSGGAADVYIIIRVRASGYGESALNPADLTTFPVEDLLPPPHSNTPSPSTFSLPPRADAHPQAARCILRRPHNIPRRRSSPFPSTSSPPSEHFRSLTQHRCTPADLTTHSPPKACSRPRTATRPARVFSHSLPAHFRSPSPHRCIPRRRPSLAHAQRHARPAHFRSPTQRRCTPAGCAMHAHCPHHPFPAAPPCPPFRSASGTKKRHRTVHVRCRMSRSTVVAVGHWGW